jgi:hypothetical protein
VFLLVFNLYLIVVILTEQNGGVKDGSKLCQVQGGFGYKKFSALPSPFTTELGTMPRLYFYPIDYPTMAKLKLDLHDIYNRGKEIDSELNRIIQEAIDKKIELVEIIPGKGSGQLKKKVLRFLNQGHIKKLYHRVEKDDKNHGRIFIHFRF